jgi:hypothetical protein
VDHFKVGMMEHPQIRPTTEFIVGTASF